MSRLDQPYARHMTQEDYEDLRSLLLDPVSKEEHLFRSRDMTARVVRVRGGRLFYDNGSATMTSCGVHYSRRAVGKTRQEIYDGGYALGPTQEEEDDAEAS